MLKNRKFIPTSQIDLNDPYEVRHQMKLRGWTHIGWDHDTKELVLSPSSRYYTNGHKSDFERNLRGSIALSIIESAIRNGQQHLFPKHMDAKWFVLRLYRGLDRNYGIPRMLTIPLNEGYTIQRMAADAKPFDPKVAGPFDSKEAAYGRLREIVQFHARVVAWDVECVIPTELTGSSRWFVDRTG